MDRLFMSIPRPLRMDFQGHNLSKELMSSNKKAFLISPIREEGEEGLSKELVIIQPIG